MSEAESVQHHEETITKKKAKQKYRIRPYSESFYNRRSGRFEYEFHLSGVSKENVELKILPELFHVEATREEENSIGIYSTTRYFTREIDPESVEASFENGLLKFSVKMKNPLDDAFEITL